MCNEARDKRGGGPIRIEQQYQTLVVQPKRSGHSHTGALRHRPGRGKDANPNDTPGPWWEEMCRDTGGCGAGGGLRCVCECVGWGVDGALYQRASGAPAHILQSHTQGAGATPARARMAVMGSDARRLRLCVHGPVVVAGTDLDMVVTPTGLPTPRPNAQY